ncbi:hypothetical protein MLD38_033071 [Melastoma candidum]|uniref:Uncharacterized protein n=1 Tax=Melastoma candidum TaxID=119954 RepID=A0ACB9M5Q6_9MYRT|nr:hypothetical protein MLD38_033071 [Melastoma candidum]
MSPEEKYSGDYSPSATTLRFDRPLPLLRGPLPADPLDCPSAGPYVLAFRDYASWLSAFASSRDRVIEQCEEGARIGCAVGASRKCAPPWWDFKKVDLKAKEECEVREMNECLVVAKEKCAGFADDKCRRPFLSARVAVRGRGMGRDLTEGLAKRLICAVGLGEKVGVLVLRDLLREERRLRYVRASELAVIEADKQ